MFYQVNLIIISFKKTIIWQPASWFTSTLPVYVVVLMHVSQFNLSLHLYIMLHNWQVTDIELQNDNNAHCLDFRLNPQTRQPSYNVNNNFVNSWNSYKS